MKRRTKVWFRSLAIILAVVMAIVSLPLSVFAEEIIGEALGAECENVFEIEELRSATTKTFRLEDGSYYLAQYDTDVHYLDENGEWKDIDNTLYQSGSEIMTSPAKIRFKKATGGSGELFSLYNGNSKLSLSLDGANKKISAEMKNNDSENDENATTLEKMTTLNKISSSVTYRDILDGVDIEYVIKGSDIKENIIVKEKSDNYSYSFTMSLNNLVVDNDEDGSIILTNINGERVYTIPAPVMWDSAGDVSNDVSMELLDNGNGKYTLNISADSEWMNDTKRSYPITIDPPIYSGSSGVTDLEINTANSSYNASSNNNIGVSATYRAYWKLNALPTIPEYAYITDATFTMSCYINEYTNGLVGVYNVLSNWDSTLTAAKTPNQGRKATSYTDLQLITTLYSGGYMSSMDSSYEWNVTPIVKSWYSGSNNYGLCFAPVDEDEFEGKAFFYSSEYALVSARPTLCISYRDMNGLEDYWTFTSQSAGFAGSGYINNSTGNLVFSIPTLSTTDSLMPITPTLVYNSSVGYGFDPSNDITNEAYDGDPFGYGFHLNICETIIQKTYKSTMTGNDIAYYVWYDGDGTSHAFMPRNENSTEYIDEDGLKMKLTLEDTGYKITDDNDTVRFFRKISGKGYLMSITDKSGNQVRFILSADACPTSIILTPAGGAYDITQLTFTYNNNTGRLTSVNNTTAGESVSFTYSNGYLSQIQYVSGGSTVATASYTYASSGALSSATNGLTNYSLNYTYNSVGKVSVVEEKASGTLGQKITLAYSTSSTVVRTSGSDDIYGNDDDLLTTYVFDSSGRTVSNYTTDINYFELYGAASGEYVTNEENENAKNSLKSSSVTTLNAPNLLLNGGFDKGIESWTSAGNAVVSSANYNVTKLDMVLTVGNGISNSSISQEVTLRNGDYTLSVLLDSENSTGASAYIRIESLTYSRDPVIKEVSLDKFNASESAILESVEFSTLMHPTENPEETERFRVTILLSGNPSSSVSLRVDEVMLIKGKGAASYDMVQMGHFETTGGNIGSYWKSGTGAALTNTSVDYKGFSRNVLMIQGKAATAYNDMDTVSKAVQVVYQLSDSEKAYFDEYGIPSDIAPMSLKLSGWAKGSAQAYGIDSQFSIMIEIKYYQNGNVSVPQIEHIKFDRGITDWQFGSVSLVTTPEHGVIESITITVDYVNNPGVAYFDDITLTKEGVSVYDYTPSGYLKSYRTNEVGYLYKYDDNDRLIRRVSSNKDVVAYTYLDETSKVVLSETYSTHSGTYDYDEDTLIAGRYREKYTVTYAYDSYGLLIRTTTKSPDDVRVILNSTSYITGNTHIFGAVDSETDSLGNQTRYFYDQNNGRLLAVLYPEGNGVTYSYDAMGNITNVFNAVLNESTGAYSTGVAAEIYYDYNNVTKRLDSIYTGSVEYGFTYDVFGNTTQISADNYTLASYTYNSRNGKLSTLTYGNGLTVKYLYDTLDRVEEIQYNIGTGNSFETVYSYEYEASGRLHSVTDHRNDEVTLYRYDASGRLLQSVVYDSETYLNKSSGYALYDSQSRLTYAVNSFDAVMNRLSETVNMSYRYYYTEDNMIDEVVLNSGDFTMYLAPAYDDFGRTKARYTDAYLDVDGPIFYNNTTYSYHQTSTTLSSRVSQVVSEVGKYSADGANYTTTYNYTYDDNGNITQITDANGVIQYKYYYDTLDRLVREDNRPLGKSYTWTYDFTSNITSKKTYAFTTGTLGSVQKTDSYGYASSWADRLTSYNGSSITYDNIGNPIQILTDGVPTFLTWQGRELLTYRDEMNGVTYNYTYNADGIRTTKNVNGVTHEYYLDGSRIIGEYVSDGYLYMYMYDENGAPIGIKFRRGDYAENTYDYYFFEKNLQGDIVAIYNENGTKIGTYTYDAWGNVTVTTHTSGIEATIVNNNPFRYRGYYYDSETGWYYLQSRYYNPTWGRFINRDSVMGVNDDMSTYNLFTYCGDNPVNRYDAGGMEWDNVVDYLLHRANDFAIAIGIDTAAVGAFFLMMEPDDIGVYHAKFDCWQQEAGYNSLYDIAFDIGTSMKSLRFSFSYDGSDYTIWTWKGDYINLGAGAELGIYRGSRGHLTVDKSLAMWMGMIVAYNGEYIIEYYPNENQWWITSFNPKYQNVNANNLLVAVGFMFNDSGMYYAFKDKWDGHSNLSFRDDLNMVIVLY